MQNYNLKVWHKAHLLALEIYKTSGAFRKDEQINITSHLWRACVSIRSNIAEGCGKFSGKDFGRFLQIALGSANETEHLILLSRELGFIEGSAFENFTKEIDQIKSMLISLLQKVRSNYLDIKLRT
jgi:four helix bundle protein